MKVLERRAFEGFDPREMPADYADFLLRLYERWYNRQRVFDNLNGGLTYTLKLAKEMVKDSDPDTAAWAAFFAERNYWQLRNRAGRVQKMRQDVLGLGWANHDHHTFRSSREAFPALLEILQTFGFQLREKFYAGSEAGWGAQVLEQPTCHLVVFADVDLKAEELALDFEQVSLKSFPEKGTVGLWCALHGESILQAGLHHLAASFSFKELQKDLERDRVLMLPPFSEFEFLKQAFTQGERWKIHQDRLKELKKEKVIDSRQFSAYRDEGVIGSHMENIQRDQGFKGFNQESVSDIIRRTDPRLDFGAA
jgi:hypothetical protein